MSKILIICSDPKLVSPIQTNLVKKFNHEVVVKPDAVDAISFMEIIGKVELILLFEIAQKDKFLAKISDYLIKNIDLYGNDIQLFSIGPEVCQYEKTRYAPSKLSLEKINQTCLFLLGDGPEPIIEITRPTIVNPLHEKTNTNIKQSNVSNSVEGTTIFQLPDDLKKGGTSNESEVAYSKINIKFLSFNKDYQINFDLYARTKKGNDYVFQLKFKKDSLITKMEVDRLLTRGGGFFYVLEADYKQASTFLVNQFISTFAYEMSPLDRITLNLLGFEILSEIFRKEEFDEFSIDLIKNSLKSFELVTNSANNFEVFFEHLKLKGLNGYSYLHPQLTCMILISLIDEFEWSKEYSKNKLVYFSYFHDLTIGSDKLVSMHHHFTRDKEKFTSEESQLIENHANITAKLLERIIKLPKELVALIREHHGILNGIGFSDTPNVRILPLSKLIIVTESFVTKYLDEVALIEKGESYKISEIQFKKLIDGLKLVYDKVGYTESLEALTKKMTIFYS